MAILNWITWDSIAVMIAHGYSVSSVEWATDEPRAIITFWHPADPQDDPDELRVIGGAWETIRSIHPDEVPA